MSPAPAEPLSWFALLGLGRPACCATGTAVASVSDELRVEPPLPVIVGGDACGTKDAAALRVDSGFQAGVEVDGFVREASCEDEQAAKTCAVSDQASRLQDSDKAEEVELLSSASNVSTSVPSCASSSTCSDKEAGNLARTPSFDGDCLQLAGFAVPAATKPTVSGCLDMGLADLHSALLRSEGGGPCAEFLSGMLGCFDIEPGPWVDCPRSADATIQRTRYSLPLPADIPESIARLLGIGRAIPSSTVSRLAADGAEVVLQQITRTEGLLYSERMRVLNTHIFRQVDSGVEWRTLTQIIWLRPLPWTHGFIARLIEHRVRSETQDQAPKLMAVLHRTGVPADSAAS